jgi:hypothetical protein
MFLDFDLLYVYFIISPRDGQLLDKFLRPVVDFPKVLEMTVRAEFLHRQSLFPVWLKIYQRNRVDPPDVMSVVFPERAEPDPDPDPNPVLDPDADIRYFEQRSMVLKKLAKEHLCHPLDIIDGKIGIPFLAMDWDVAPNGTSELGRCGAGAVAVAVAVSVAGAGAGEANEICLHIVEQIGQRLDALSPFSP